MPEIPDVTPGGTIQTAWGNQIRDRAIMRYANAGARDASVLVPVDGDVAWLSDVNELTMYSGAAWLIVGPYTPQVVPGARFVTGLSVTLTAPTNSTQLLHTFTNVDTVANRWMVTATANIEAVLSGAVEIIWDFEIRTQLPSTTTIALCQIDNSTTDVNFKGAVTVAGLTSTAAGSNSIELIARRDNTGGAQIVTNIAFTAVPLLN